MQSQAERYTPRTPDMFSGTDRGAFISADEKYRYRLWRTWDFSKPKVMFVMLNPSTADADEDDPTIRRCIGFAQDWGYGGLLVGNLFAFRATNAWKIRLEADPVGPENDEHLLAMALEAGRIVCAWGGHGPYLHQDRHVCELLKAQGYALYCLGINRVNGDPKHPLYLRKDTKLRRLRSCA